MRFSSRGLLCLLLFGLLSSQTFSQKKKRVEDQDWLDVPFFGIEVPDSTQKVQFYSGEVMQALKSDQEPGNMKLYAEVIFDEMGRQIKLEYFRNYDQRAYISYNYTYLDDSEMIVTKRSLSGKDYEWYYKDSTIVKEIAYKSSGIPKYIWKYENLNDSVFYKIQKKKGNGKEVYTWINSLDTNSLELRLNKYVKGELVNMVIYQFRDTVGIEIAAEYELEDVNFLSQTLRIPADSLVNIPGRTICAKAKAKAKHYSVELDTLNRVVKKSCYTGFNGRVFEYAYAYNILNQVAEIKSLKGPDKKPLFTTIKYNENGDVLERVYYQEEINKSKQIGKSIRVYNEEGYPIKALDVFDTGPYSYSSCERIEYVLKE